MYKRRVVKLKCIFRRKDLFNTLSLVITWKVYGMRVCIYDAVIELIMCVISKSNFLIFTASRHNWLEELGQFLLHEQYHSMFE